MPAIYRWQCTRNTAHTWEGAAEDTFTANVGNGQAIGSGVRCPYCLLAFIAANVPGGDIVSKEVVRE